MNPTRWRRASRVAMAGAGQAAAPLYVPDPGTSGALNVRQLTISSDAAAEIVVYFGAAAADRLDYTKAIAAVFLGANGGASPDLSCLGAWTPLLGQAIQLYASAVCNLWIEIAGVVEN